jgi:hypothetical protein
MSKLDSVCGEDERVTHWRQEEREGRSHARQEDCSSLFLGTLISCVSYGPNVLATPRS